MRRLGGLRLAHRRHETLAPMNLNSYQLQTKWAFTAPPDHVYLALAQLDDYPAWWPEVRAVRRVDDASRQITCRSVLPYNLTSSAAMPARTGTRGSSKPASAETSTDSQVGLSPPRPRVAPQC